MNGSIDSMYLSSLCFTYCRSFLRNDRQAQTFKMTAKYNSRFSLLFEQILCDTINKHLNILAVVSETTFTYYIFHMFQSDSGHFQEDISVMKK